MAITSNGESRLIPSPDYPGWMVFPAPDPDGFNHQVLGPTLVRGEGKASARVRITPSPKLANIMGNVNGGASARS